MAFLPIFTLSLLCLSVSSSVSAEILTLHDSNNNFASSIAVSVNNQELHEVANSLLMAETWLRNQVLNFYPGSNITHIVVGHNLLCSHKSHDHSHYNLILPALKNFHHSLTRWGLQHNIKVSASLTSLCLSNHLSHSVLEPVLHFIRSTNSSYLINSPDEADPKFETLVQTHIEFIKKIGTLSFNGKIYLVKNISQLPTTPTMRKLSFVLPTPSPTEQRPISQGPLPPLVGLGPITSPPSPPSPYHTPHMGLSPTHSPHPHHHHHNLPPCNPWAGPVGPVASPPPSTPPLAQEAPSPVVAQEKLWCVAKPSVPAETLQEAMDFACGEAECDEIQPNGSCYYPDTVVAHASYAFNSYFQKARRNGGSCDFSGAAMIINSDPSFLQCTFSVS